MSLSNIFSFIFYLAFFIYFLFSMYVLHLSVKSTLHRVFFLSCLALCFWAFSFSAAIAAPDYYTSITWRRIASLGWGTFFSFLLHFTLILTGQEKLLHRKWPYLILYLPAIITVTVFGVIKQSASRQYHMVKTIVGWANIPRHNFWDIFYNVFYMCFSLCILILICRWGITSKDKLIRKQGILLFTGYLLAVLAGGITEFFTNYLGTFQVPQIAPVIGVIPISIIYFCIRRYGLIAAEGRNKKAREGQILSEATRFKLFRYLVRVYYLGAFVSFVGLRYSIRRPIGEALLFSIILLCAGAVLQLIQDLKLESAKKDILSYCIMTATTPLIMIRFIDYSPLYAWVVPVVLILFSIAFSHRLMLSLIGASTIVTMIILWAHHPEITLTFGLSDHLIRIASLALVLWIAYYINHLYLARLAENEEQIKRQRLLSGISALFVTVNESNLDDKMKQMLKMCGEHFMVDRTYLYILDDTERYGPRRYLWTNPKQNSSYTSTVNTAPTGHSHWVNTEQLLSEGMIYQPDVSELPEDSPERIWMEKYLIQSMLILPLRNKESIRGYWHLEKMQQGGNSLEEQSEILTVLANLTADVCYKVGVERDTNYRANYDSLTGLPNRDLFKSHLNQAISEADQSGKTLGVIFIDVDSFKLINDTIGHEGGDSLLIQMGSRLSDILKQKDIISRFGGDEFLILISQAEQVEDILKEADKIIDMIKQPIEIKNQEYFITVSAGIAIYPYDGDNAEDLIKHSDLAMYISKQQGKNHYTICSDIMKKKVLTNMELTNSLYRALERNELQLYYQPQISIDTGEITGLEALLRWQHPERGMIRPSDFIHVAEKTGLIHPIGQWVLETACRQNKEWQDQGLRPIKMAVNLSVAQFRNPNLIDNIKSALNQSGLNPSYLELEVTESIAVNEAEATLNTLYELKELGISISMDDFGMEYSSLNRIKNLPVDRIKIDSQFIQGITQSGKDEGIITVIIQLGKTLGLNIIAEGVETKQQLDFLKDHQCEHVQGFYFYHPMPYQELEPILTQKLLD